MKAGLKFYLLSLGIPRLFYWLAMSVLLVGSHNLLAQGTAFTYQGRLNDGSGPANGTYNFSFALYLTNVSGAPVGGALTKSSVAVTNGLFTTVLDFGSVFDGTAYWLEIGVQTNGSTNDFTILSPRQALSSTPYAVYAANAGTVTGVLATTNLPASVALLNGNQIFSGNISAPAFVGDGSALTNLNGSQLTGGKVSDALLSTNVALLNGSQMFFSTNTFLKPLVIGSNLTSVAVNDASASWTLSQRFIITGIPVPSFRPIQSRQTLAFDLMPNGSAMDTGFGESWLDICAVDCLNNQPSPLPSLHLSAHTNFMEISSVTYNGGKALPLLFGAGNGNISGDTYVFGITNNAFKVFTNSASFYGGVASYATNNNVVGVTGWTNNLGVNAVVYLTAATDLQLYDSQGNAVFSSPQSIGSLATLEVQPGGYFTGTAITAVGNAHAQ